ncbi:MAG: precorrin-8W decarboxylase [Candidatus Methanoperedens nitroreducens]|uniref:Precorrin-8W decarboxylase n=1 Tax=Candidatus Methanoperedens nitratireducens TaxID=1392998 RepID=A0A0P8CBE6_9EURY|nr:precorrin-6Y C5,15-methyltransferase (decarboxylating) subunit CbiT [Candidatus Methanoperedens sp. BLZ2]KAB2943056.1 MAG: precorrin-6Y C5,15-methyltransferase (decarboxylating) subunit CbiT [Candidatus Methanoperedens sp.]KPQ44155.1 MAG: precorrin-8W decarboxylase [Candidatus Methanoperedens sp. BLZ1]MBZ0176485.1 precorrin-6Y C5,15-methyltransferase (decarboxylating) subunit CbiT [Candidatus Methanoperedens nitroreducens]CAG0990324.1 cobalt-precorrin-6B (C15)-methyltransferase [Methanosarci
MLYPPGTPTQPEIIAIALSKLNIKSTDVFADIGCGSGSVSIAASGLAKHVFAIDNRDDAINAASGNIKECSIKNISLLKGDAIILLPDIDMDCAFIGGSKNIKQVMEILIEKKKPKMRFVVSAVKVETVAIAMEIMKKNNVFKELLQIQISRGNELAGGTMFKPENPIFLVVGGA